MQRTEIHWSPNDRNQLAEIGAEIIVHTFDRPLTGESGKCLSGGTNKKTTKLNYPLNEKNHIKCCAWWPSQEYPYVFAIGQPNGKIIFENVKDRLDPWSQERIVIDSKQGRACVALAWNPKIPNLLLSGFDKSRNDTCLTIWDINHSSTSSSSSPSPLQSIGGGTITTAAAAAATTTTTTTTSTTGTTTTTSNLDEYKRVDLMIHNQQIWKPLFDYGNSEQCHSLTWLKPNERVFAAATTLHTTRSIRIYDPRASPSVSLSIPGKAPFQLCADTSERYLASCIDKNVYVYDIRSHEKALIIREEQEPIVKLSWSRNGSSQLGYCIRDSPKFHLLSLSNVQHHENETFIHRILQCPIQRYRIDLGSFDWNYFDEDRLVLLSGKEYFDYVIPSKSSICYSPRNGLLWTDGHQIHSSLIPQDQNQLSSKVIFNYDLSNIYQDRRNFPSNLNNEKIELNLSEMGKDARSTVEQIQRWVKNTNSNRDPYPFLGVIESFREVQSSSSTTTTTTGTGNSTNATSTISHHSWSSMGHSTSTKTVYDSPERQSVIQLCGWTTNNDSKTNSIHDRMNSLIEQDQFEKAAAIYIFQMNMSRALEVLHSGLKQGGREELATLILALIGFIRATSTGNDEKNLFNEYSSITNLFHRPYVRAMFAFILTQDGNDLQYQCVLDEHLDLNDKVAFAARYLNDQRLYEKLEKLADESRDKGDLQGILLTGLRQNGCELIQKYLDQTNDIRTAALLGIYIPEDVCQECSYVQEWIEGYRLLLDELQMWNERAEFDIFRNHISDSTSSHRRHLFDRSQNVPSYNSCIFCQTSLDNPSNNSSSTTPTTSTGNSSSNIPMKPNNRSSQQGFTNRSSTSSTSNPTELLTICNKCRQALPRCSICMMNLTTYIEDASCAYEPTTDKQSLMSSQWFTWCRLCRHGGHAEHVSNWFAMNDKCPIAKCSCRCTLIDGIFSS